ncbi:hypothetical protein PYCCODRAFT_426743 [Trametes coccinea BRFM310]|uniref:Uncharacterized protein n=1 Tax=Trametes coccinea (strain BRFM310) TaxID=1353009 RepID=A0A1Y2IQQ2_TRAC3|nr:hypothetical protein PYCCODRAFT_426743 [Trametes coccinea BRFM310]
MVFATHASLLYPTTPDEACPGSQKEAESVRKRIPEKPKAATAPLCSLALTQEVFHLSGRNAVGMPSSTKPLASTRVLALKAMEGTPVHFRCRYLSRTLPSKPCTHLHAWGDILYMDSLCAAHLIPEAVSELRPPRGLSLQDLLTSTRAPHLSAVLYLADRSRGKDPLQSPHISGVTTMSNALC